MGPTSRGPPATKGSDHSYYQLYHSYLLDIFAPEIGGIVGQQFPYFWSKRFMMSVDNGCLHL